MLNILFVEINKKNYSSMLFGDKGEWRVVVKRINYLEEKESPAICSTSGKTVYERKRLFIVKWGWGDLGRFY